MRGNVFGEFEYTTERRDALTVTVDDCAGAPFNLVASVSNLTKSVLEQRSSGQSIYRTASRLSHSSVASRDSPLIRQTSLSGPIITSILVE